MATSELGLLRVTTAGNVDDGKSTLVGRLLFDTKSLFDDQLATLKRISRVDDDAMINLALITDGLRAEREQGITIDVAYRYFATPRRKFILADSPGHEQYTRNMVTAASVSQLSILLVDATRGITEQTRRHALISTLFRIPHLVVCVNKMDLVDFSEQVFAEIRSGLLELVAGFELEPIRAITFIPISALQGDNVASKSARMGWYRGKALLEHLETVEVRDESDLGDFRLRVQLPVVGPDGFRGFAGKVSTGVARAGDTVTVLPSNTEARVLDVTLGGEKLDRAEAPLSVVIRLDTELDVARGDMLAAGGRSPRVAKELEATVCWMSAKKLSAGGRYLLRQGPFETRCLIKSVASDAPLGLNEIGRVRLSTAQPMSFDTYAENRQTGSFILIDEASFETVAGGTIL